VTSCCSAGSPPLPLQYAGGAAIGAFAGLFVGLIFLPSLESVEQYTGGALSGFSGRLLAGLAIGIVGCLALVATGTFVGPFSAASVENIGVYAVRGTVGTLAGLGIGVTIGAILGLSSTRSAATSRKSEEVDIEEMTDGNVVDAMMEEFRQFSPGGANALIDERDAYIASNLHELREQGVRRPRRRRCRSQGRHRTTSAEPRGNPVDRVAVRHRLEPPVFAREDRGLPDHGRLFRLLLPVAHGGVRNMFLLKVFVAWFLFNGIFAFTLARLAGARWTSAGVGGAVAWLTSINPLLAPGWFAGYVELKSRPVNVRDIQTLNEIIDDTERPVDEAMSAMFDVPLFRLIMIVALTNIGSMIATALFPFVVLP